MNYDRQANLAAMFFDVMTEQTEKPLLWAKRDGAWRPTTRGEAAADATALAAALAAFGIGPGDRVMLVSENRPEWPIADLGIMAAGAITVPAYATNQPGDHLHILTNSGAKGAIVSTASLAEKLLPAAAQAPELQFVLAIEPTNRAQSFLKPIHGWRETLDKHRPSNGVRPATVDRIKRTDTACIIYTSGTGGVPKGVMLSHGAILSNCKGAYYLLLEIGLDDEVFLSFLPLSHSYEHTAGMHFPLSIGAQIYYAEGADKLGPNMIEVRPSIMTAVPRLYETMHRRITAGVAAKGGLSEKLFNRAVELGAKRYRNQSLTIGERIVDAALDVLVRKKVRARFGDRLKVMVSGGAPLNADIGVFFTALGLRILQGYGLTESAPIIACNLPSKVRLETVGPPMVDIEVKVADDGEICARGELVMQGYWGDPATTAEAIKDGWLHTGDIGEIDADGFIRITDRKKDVIVNSGGDNISPQRVEGFLTLQPEVSQAMVYGDKRPHLVALIVPDEGWAAHWAKTHGKPNELGTLISDPAFNEAVGAAVERVSATLSPLERVRKFATIAEPFTTANEMMTPTLKIRRHKILAAYRPRLDALYGG
jgi:long-chain acyl-CoA synthetase